MLGYFAKRLALLIPTLAGILLAVFILMSMLPGTEQTALVNEGENGFWRVIDMLPLERSSLTDWLGYMYDIAVYGDFGPSPYAGHSLNELLVGRMLITLLLTGLGLSVSLLVGVPAGLLAAKKKHGMADRSISVLTLLLSSLPSYCLAVILVLFFSLRLHLLPVYGSDSVKSFILPVAVVSAGGIASVARIVRSAVSETLEQTFVTVLRAKGISEHRVIWIHVMGNTAVTVLSAANNLAVQLFCGTVIVENLFSLPGLGKMLVLAIGSRSRYTVLGCVTVISAVLMLMNIMFDFICALVNPQMRVKLCSGNTWGMANGK